MNNNHIDDPVIILAGPTSIGKTELSLQLAESFNCEIISVDSMQVYKHMDIGTAKISMEDRARVIHHLIDIIDPNENYDAVRFTQDAVVAIRKIHLKGKIPILTGGTGLYFKALIHGIFPGVASNSKIRQKLIGRLNDEGSHVLHDELILCDPISANKIHKNDSHRVVRALEIYHYTGKPWSAFLASEVNETPQIKFSKLLQIGLSCDRKTLYDRINLRTEVMIESGLEKEVRGLLEMGYGRDLKSMGSIGYRHITSFIFGEWTFEEMKMLLARDTRRYAKRQLTWFSKVKDINWIEVNNKGRVSETIDKWLKI